MKADEALEWAADYAKRSGLFDPVTNSRGYADNWKPPTPQEKMQVIRQLAADVTDPNISLIQSLAKLCDHGHVICVQCDHVPSSWKVQP